MKILYGNTAVQKHISKFPINGKQKGLSQNYLPVISIYLNVFQQQKSGLHYYMGLITTTHLWSQHQILYRLGSLDFRVLFIIYQNTIVINQNFSISRQVNKLLQISMQTKAYTVFPHIVSALEQFPLQNSFRSKNSVNWAKN